MNLEDLADAARAEAPVWDEARRARVLEGVRSVGARRVARARLVRRAVGVASMAALVVFVISKASSSSADSGVEHARVVDESIAMAANGDGGYGRD